MAVRGLAELLAGQLELNTIRRYLMSSALLVSAPRERSRLPKLLSAFDHGCTGTGVKGDVGKVGAISPRPFLFAR